MRIRRAPWSVLEYSPTSHDWPDGAIHNVAAHILTADSTDRTLRRTARRILEQSFSPSGETPRVADLEVIKPETAGASLCAGSTRQGSGRRYSLSTDFSRIDKSVGARCESQP
jgi:hypothetical protein